MRRELLAISFVFLLLIIVGAEQGCGTGQPQGKENPYIGGTDGVLIDFVEGSPPPEIFDIGYPFQITVRLKNVGEDDVETNEGRVDISGISSNDFGGVYTLPFPEKLLGSYKSPEGDPVEGSTTYLSFPGFQYRKILPGNTQFTVRADVCYRYETRATTRLCVRKNVLAYGEETICELDEDKIVFNSGSPVQISSFTQNVGGKDKLSFTFKVAHKGVGAIYSPEGTLCETTDLAKKNKVLITVDTGMPGTSCSILGGDNTGYATLYDGTISVTCIQPVPGGEVSKAYETPITIKVSFDYRQHKDIPLLVKHIH